MEDKSILKVEKLDFRWGVENPFLFCAHHRDNYPGGNGELGVKAEELIDRNRGNDFELKDGFRMYHGRRIPGFPSHPHRGFETVTIVLEGFVDHSDSHGASGRYGEGDVQWMTAGSGLQHAEMFPLINKEGRNFLHLFQVWLNLPKKDKFTKPHYKMLWSEDIPIIEDKDEKGNLSSIRLIAGKYKDYNSLEPAPSSWANNPENKVNIWIVKLNPNTEFELAKVNDSISRNIYYYSGDNISINGDLIQVNSRVKLDGNAKINIINGEMESYILLLEGEPINEPVVAYGPFVMNTMEEIKAAYDDYQNTKFGGWPWDSSDPVHGNKKNRFARYSDGRLEERGKRNGF